MPRYFHGETKKLAKRFEDELKRPGPGPPPSLPPSLQLLGAGPLFQTRVSLYCLPEYQHWASNQQSILTSDWYGLLREASGCYAQEFGYRVLVLDDLDRNHPPKSKILKP